jgi:hypothetical protein
MFSQRQVAVLAGFIVLLGSRNARAEDVCALEEQVAALESQVASLAAEEGPRGRRGAQGDTGSQGAAGPAGKDAFDDAEQEYGPRLEALSTRKAPMLADLATVVASADALEVKLAALTKKASDVNRNPYLIAGPNLGTGYPVLSWPTGVAELSYAVDESTVVTCRDPAVSQVCVYSVAFAPGVIPPVQCSTSSSDWLFSCGTVTLDNSYDFDGEIIGLTRLEFDLQSWPPKPKNVTPELVAYIEALGKNPEHLLGICSSFSALGPSYAAGEWSREPALRAARKVRADPATTIAELEALEANPTLAPEDEGDPDALAEVKAGYRLMRQGIEALAAATEEEAAQFIHASAFAADSSGMWRYLYTQEQAEMFIQGIRGNTAGWSNAKKSAFELTRASVERMLKSRQDAIHARAKAMNAEWWSIADGDQLQLLDLFKTNDYPDVIGLAIQQVNEEARANWPVHVLQAFTLLGGTAVSVVAVATSATAFAAVAGTHASLFAGLSTLSSAATVGIIAGPVLIVLTGVAIAIVGGIQAFESAGNRQKYERWMANFANSYDLAQLDDQAIRAAYTDWGMAWKEKNVISVGAQHCD